MLEEMKRGENKWVMRRSQSIGAIIQGTFTTKANLDCSQSLHGFRSLSHDSVFHTHSCQSYHVASKVLFRENIQDKIKALHVKLQKQKMHFGPPPVQISNERCLTEDPGELTVSSHSVRSAPPLIFPSGVDFTTPPQFTSCLDNSAARHRMSIKPRNQRASTKNRKPSSFIIWPGEGITAPLGEMQLPHSQVNCLVRSTHDNHPPAASLHHPVLKEAEIIKSTERSDNVETKLEFRCSSLSLAARQMGGEDQCEVPYSSEIQSIQENPEWTASSSRLVNDASAQKLHHKTDCRLATYYNETHTKSYNEKKNELNKISILETMSKVDFKGLSPSLSALQRNVYAKEIKGDGRTEGTTGQLHVDCTSQYVPMKLSTHFPVSSDTNYIQQKTGDLIYPVEQEESNFKSGKLSQTHQTTTSECEMETDKASQGTYCNDVIKKKRKEREQETLSGRPGEIALPLKIHPDKALSGSKVTDLTVEGHKDNTIHTRDSLLSKVLKNPKQTTEVQTSCCPTSNRDQMRMLPCKQSDSETSIQRSSSSIKTTTGVHSLPSKESTPVCFTEDTPGEGELRESLSDLSWMNLAREKTRSLQQLFTSRLTDLAGFQTVTRPASSTQTHPSKQSVEIVRPAHQIPVEQSTLKPIQSIYPHSPALLHSCPAAHPAIESIISPAQPSMGQTEEAGFSRRQIISTAFEAQVTKQFAKPEEMTASGPQTTLYSTNPTSATILCDTNVTSQNLIAQERLFEQLPQSSHLFQPACSYLSSIPNLGHPNLSQCSTSPSIQHRPQFSGDAFFTPVRHTDKPFENPIDNRVQWAHGIGSKLLSTEELLPEKSDLFKEDQKSMNFKNMSFHTSLTESAASPVPLRLDKESKFQKKAIPSSSPSSISPLQSSTDSGQPSWFELAKRKSMAWSDKTMD